MVSNHLDASHQPLPLGRRPTRLESGLLFGLVVLVYLYVIQTQPLGWDEGYTFDRQNHLRPWLARIGNALAAGSWSELQRAFSSETLRKVWHFSREEPHGHGPFYALLSLVGEAVSGWLLSPPASLRFGSVVLFATAATCVFSAMTRTFGTIAGWTTALLLVSMPRIVPEVGYALIDGPLLSVALLAWVGLIRLMTHERWIGGLILFGAAYGAAMANKLTGWLLIAPFLATATLQTALTRRMSPLGKFAAGALLALSTTLFLNVGWWPDPVAGVDGFFESNLTRGETIRIGIQFWGVRYDFSLPWYNTIVWMVVAVPPGTLLLGLIGLGKVLGNAVRGHLDLVGLSIVFGWGLLMVVRAMPNVPGHDGVRQLIISLGFLTLLAGIGAATLLGILARWRRAGRFGAIALIAAAVIESAGSSVLYHPHQLSYYSPLIGGLPGAARAGFEPTYFWDGLTPEVLAWIDQHTPPNRWVFFRNITGSLKYADQWHQLRTRYHPPEPTSVIDPIPLWFVIQNRPGLFTPQDDWIMTHGTPVFETRLFGVPLIRIYPFEQYQEAHRAVHEASKEGK